jgi:NAD(P)-dependent dehydrogenase (short-subunit alcohol dehydrogenase family)
LAEADEIAASVAYLASAKARYIIGTRLATDDGETQTDDTHINILSRMAWHNSE